MATVGRPNNSTTVGATSTLREITTFTTPVVVIQLIGQRRVDGSYTDIHEVQFQWDQPDIQNFEIDDILWSPNIVVENLENRASGYFR